MPLGAYSDRRWQTQTRIRGWRTASSRLRHPRMIGVNPLNNWRPWHKPSTRKGHRQCCYPEAITYYLNDLTVRRGPYTVRNQTGCLQTFKGFLSSQHPDDHAWTVEDALTLSRCRAFMATLANAASAPRP